jgi:hypothetical protein
MESAMQKGAAKGILTGPVAEQIQQATRSNEATQAVLERLEEVAGCQFFKFTMTQPKVPTQTGSIAGDYVTVTRVGTCRDGKKRPPPVVLACSVGSIDCMLPK